MRAWEMLGWFRKLQYLKRLGIGVAGKREFGSGATEVWRFNARCWWGEGNGLVRTSSCVTTGFWEIGKPGPCCTCLRSLSWLVTGWCSQGCDELYMRTTSNSSLSRTPAMVAASHGSAQ